MKVSKTGYKKNSKDKNQPSLLIPSNRITMKGVEFPVLGTDNYGNQQMMYPGQEYSFPGDYVYEKPMKNWLNKYQEGGEPKPMTWTEYLKYINVDDPELKSINPRDYLLWEEDAHTLLKDLDSEKAKNARGLGVNFYERSGRYTPHESDLLKDAYSARKSDIIDTYNLLYFNSDKQDYSGSPGNVTKWENGKDVFYPGKFAIENEGDESLTAQEILERTKKNYNLPIQDYASQRIKNRPNYADTKIPYTRVYPRTLLMDYNNPSADFNAGIEYMNDPRYTDVSENFYSDPPSARPMSFFPAPSYDYTNVPKRYDEKGNEVVSKYDVPNIKPNTYYDFPGSNTEMIYNEKLRLNDITKENIRNIKTIDPSGNIGDIDYNTVAAKRYINDPWFFYGKERHDGDPYCINCDKLAGSEHSQDNLFDYFKFKPQSPSSKMWWMKTFGLKPPRPIFLSQPNATRTGQVQIGWDIWDPKQQQWKAQNFSTDEINRRREQVKVPKDGGRDVEFKDSVIHDLAPYSLPPDIKPGTVVDTNNKPVIKEKQSGPKVVPSPNFKSGGWLDSYDTMTPAWSRNPEGNWVVKAQNGLQYIDEPTRTDSLELLNNSRMVLNYYKSKGYDVVPPIYLKNEADKKDVQEVTESARKYYEPNRGRHTPAGLDEKVPLSDYYKKKDKNKYYQREYANSILDTRSPMVLYDKRILPTMEIGYLNDIPGDVMIGDMVSISAYDPLSITPWDMLTDKQKKLRVKRFGRDGVPESYDPNKETPPANKYENLKPLPIKLLPLQGPEDRLIREYNVLVPNEKYKKVYDKSPYSTKEYGPEGMFTHWAKEDEKIPGIWRPIKGTPSDLFVTKRVKYQKGGVHQKVYRNAEEFAKANKAYNDSLDLYTKGLAFNKKHIPSDNYDSFSVPYDDVYWTAAGPGGYFIDTPSGRWFLGKTGVFSRPGSEHNKIFTESFANKIKPIGFDTVDFPYPVYKKPTEEPVYEQLKNLTPLDARFELPKPKLDIGKPAVKSQGIRIRPMMTADQNTTTGQYQSGKYIWDPQTKSWKVKMLSPEAQQENREEVKLKSKKNGGWLDQYQGDKESSQVERRDPNQPFFPSATEAGTYESQYSLPEVSVTPNWTEAELERNRLRDKYIADDKKAFRHWYDKLGYDKDNVTKRANQYAYNKLAKQYLKGDKDKLTPEQRKFIEKSEYASRLQPSVGSRFVEGVTNPGFNLETVTNLLAPFEYPGNLVRGAVTGEFTDALKGQTPSPYFVSSDLAGTSPTQAAIASGLMTVGTDPLFLTGDEVLGGVGKGARGLRKFFRKSNNLPEVPQPGVLPTGPSKSLNEITADVDALNATIKPRSEATTEDMQSLLDRLQSINRSLEEHIDPNALDDLDDMSFDPSITDDIDSVDPDLFKSMKDRLKGLERDIQNEELARDQELDKILNKEVPEEFSIEARRAGAKGPEQTGFFTEPEINEKLAQYDDYLQQRKYFDEMFPENPEDILMDMFRGTDRIREREQMFENLFPNAKKPDWFGKEYRPKDSAYLRNRLKYEPNTPFHKYRDKTSELGLKSLLDFEKKTNTQLPFQKYISQVEQEMSDPTSWYNTDPKGFVMEFRGQLDLDPKYIDGLNDKELRELAEDIQIARIRGWKESIIEQLNQKGPKPDTSLPPERLNKYGGPIKWLDKYQDGSQVPQSWKDKYDWTPNVEEEYQQFKNDPNAPENLRFTDDMKDYNTRGMWDSLDRPSNWQQALDLFKQQQGYEWTPEDDGYYHAWSQHPGTGEWLKPKHHSTGWMNYIGYAFDPNTTAVVNPEGFFGNDTLQAYPRKKKGGVKSSAEGYYDYINGYSGIFAKGGTKSWLDNYK